MVHDQGSHRELITKLPVFSLFFQRHKVKFPDHGNPRTALLQLMKSSCDQTSLQTI